MEVKLRKFVIGIKKLLNVEVLCICMKLLWKKVIAMKFSADWSKCLSIFFGKFKGSFKNYLKDFLHKV